MFDRLAFKEKGKYFFLANYWPSVLTIFTASLIVGSFDFVISTDANTYQLNVNFFNQFISIPTDEVFSNLTASALFGLTSAHFFILIALLSLAFQLLIINPFIIGKSRFTLNLSCQRARFEDLFSSYQSGYFLKTSCTLLIMNLIILLYSLCFIIPGIYKSYCYALVPYLLADDPFLSHQEALARSQNLMVGHKLDLFIFDLSFIGWNILASLSFGLLNVFFVAPYYESSKAQVYLALSKLND